MMADSSSSESDDALRDISMNTVVKSVHLQCNTLVHWNAGTKDSSTKRLMFQVLFFLHNFLQNSFKKMFQFIFLFFLMKIKSFECPKSINNKEKKLL